MRKCPHRERYKGGWEINRRPKAPPHGLGAIGYRYWDRGVTLPLGRDLRKCLYLVALNALEQTPAHEKIIKLLREVKETYQDYVTRILFGRVGLELKEAPFSFPVPANRLSDGTLRFLALCAILLQTDPPPLICLEEPELGMHPDMIRMVARMIIEAAEKMQLVVTTHSEHLLTALQDDFDILFAFDTGKTGSSVRPFSRKEFENWRESHLLGELWTSGELGGNRW